MLFLPLLIPLRAVVFLCGDEFNALASMRLLEDSNLVNFQSQSPFESSTHGGIIKILEALTNTGHTQFSQQLEHARYKAS